MVGYAYFLEGKYFHNFSFQLIWELCQSGPLFLGGWMSQAGSVRGWNIQAGVGGWVTKRYSHTSHERAVKYFTIVWSLNLSYQTFDLPRKFSSLAMRGPGILEWYLLLCRNYKFLAESSPANSCKIGSLRLGWGFHQIYGGMFLPTKGILNLKMMILEAASSLLRGLCLRSQAFVYLWIFSQIIFLYMDRIH